MSVTLEPLDPTSCDRELIHAPGSIQPHGMMLVAATEDLRVQHVAGDIEHRPGVTASKGQPLKVLISDVIGEKIAALAMPYGMGGFNGTAADVGRRAAGRHRPSRRHPHHSRT
ncbi:hypothetical protein HN018_26500 (plasmid) [Lichenicola cladoniae]|uniref:PAS fold-2 domain-containing protein n=1 Tax=Lichenicola cladoniae TaxID=1484109 RepID=A0A6M8I0A1_9PROT|nr:hypothetical protein [Acetobacteraceae bacterium]QKE93691.1 hypothetical protein HN018_26500 [Lichenicola cladoniae]